MFEFRDPYDGIYARTLKNGLSVSIKEWPIAVNWLRLGVVVHAGARQDPRGRRGMAHLVEHLVAENVEGMTFPQLQELFHKFGSDVSFGETSYLATTYEMKIPLRERTIQEAVRLFGQMLLCGKLTCGIDHEKTIILREYHEAYPHERSRDWELQGRPSLFADHPHLSSYHTALGVLDEMLLSSQQEIQAFYDGNYVPQNMSAVVISPLPIESVLALLEDTPFALDKWGRRTVLPALFSPRPPELHEQLVHLSDFSQLHYTQAQCTIEWVVPLSFTQKCVSMFCELLERKLYEELRYSDRSLTYGVDVDFAYWQDCRTLYVHFEVPPQALDVSKEILWQSLRSVPQLKEQFLADKGVRIDHLHMLDLAGHNLINNAMNDLKLYQRLIPYTEELGQVEETHFEEIVALAEYLTPERHFCFTKLP